VLFLGALLAAHALATPVIVIRPCPAGSCWYAGWPNAADAAGLPGSVTTVDDGDAPKVPYYWNHDAGVVNIRVTVTIRKESTTYDAKSVALMLNTAQDLRLSVEHRGDVPTWSVKGAALPGEPFRPRSTWPKSLVGHISKVEFTEWDGTERMIPVEELTEIRIVYSQ